MTLSHALQAFFVDLKLQAALSVIVLDFVVGVLAAWKTATLRLSYLADFGRNDIAFKLLPWAAIYVGAKFAGHQQLVIPGFDLSGVADAIYVVVMASWAASITGSLATLRLPGAKQTLHAAIFGAENEAPPES